MPYIESGVRGSLEDGRKPTKAGELNYLITKMCDEYIMSKGLSYSTVNDVIGVLACATAELYRRIATPYEDKKRSENGDVYNSVSL